MEKMLDSYKNARGGDKNREKIWSLVQIVIFYFFSVKKYEKGTSVSYSLVDSKCHSYDVSRVDIDAIERHCKIDI